MKSIKREKRYYSDTFKLSIIQEVVEGKLSKQEARKKYNIGGSSTIIGWMRKFGFLPHLNPEIMPDDKKQNIINREAHFLKEIDSLKKKLKYQTMRADCFSRWLDEAEKEFKLSLKKKHVI